MQAGTLESPPFGGGDASGRLGDRAPAQPGTAAAQANGPGPVAPAGPAGPVASGGPDGDWALLDGYSRTVAWVAEQLLPSVGALRVEDNMRRPFASGSAVVISADGLAVTSAHVVSSASRGTASFTNGEEVPFEVVGSDRSSDLAVVRLAGNGYQPAQLGEAARLKVGQLVVAIGNPLGFEGSVSAGVVSALGRSLLAPTGPSSRLLGDVIQTDAALHPGNSGGALATSAAEVVGINTALVGPWMGQGLGMAVPVNKTTRAIIGILAAGRVVRRAYLGIGGGSRPLPTALARATGFTHGIEVVSVVTSSPADNAGLRPRERDRVGRRASGARRPRAASAAH